VPSDGRAGGRAGGRSGGLAGGRSVYIYPCREGSVPQIPSIVFKSSRWNLLHINPMTSECS